MEITWEIQSQRAAVETERFDVREMTGERLSELASILTDVCMAGAAAGWKKVWVHYINIRDEEGNPDGHLGYFRFLIEADPREGRGLAPVTVAKVPEKGE